MLDGDSIHLQICLFPAIPSFSLLSPLEAWQIWTCQSDLLSSGCFWLVGALSVTHGILHTIVLWMAVPSFRGYHVIWYTALLGSGHLTPFLLCLKGVTDPLVFKKKNLELASYYIFPCDSPTLYCTFVHSLFVNKFILNLSWFECAI